MAEVTLNQIAQLLDDKLKPVQSGLEVRLAQLLDEKLEEKLEPIRLVLQEHTEILQQHSKILQQHTKQLRSLKKDQDVMLNALDKEQMTQRKKIKRLETHLSLPAFAE